MFQTLSKFQIFIFMHITILLQHIKLYNYPPAAPTNRHRAAGLDIGLLDLTREFWSQVGTFFHPTWAQNGTKMVPRWPQDGFLEGLGAIWGASWPQDGAKRVPRSKNPIRSPHVGVQVGTPFSTFSAPGWFTRGLETHLDDMLCPDTKF